MAYRSAKVLVVDDDARLCELIEGVLAGFSLKCVSISAGQDARPPLLTGEYDVAILDVSAGAVAGPELLEFISDHHLGTRVICTTDVASPDLDQAARPPGAWALLEKPIDMWLLADAVCLAAGVPGPRRRQWSWPGDESSADTAAEPTLSKKLQAYRTALAGGQVIPPDGRFRQILLEFAGAMVRAVEAKDPFTRRHSDHVAFYAEHLCHCAALTSRERDCIRIAALLHDIGKIAVPDVVLTKPSKLSEKEFAVVRRHPEVGADILGNISLMKVEARLVRCHHENWDGSGYPAGLRGEDIPLGSRILNIADSMDAMLMQRTYRDAYPPDRMLEEIERCAGTQFDPDLAGMGVRFWQQNMAKLILPSPAVEMESA